MTEPTTPRPTGQAYDKAETYLYTWYSDGRVTRQEIWGIRKTRVI